MKKTMLALALGALVASTAAMAAPFQADEHHDHDRDQHANVVEHDRGMHEGWYHKGGAVPTEYRDHRYVVDNWRDYHLREPPHGYQWVRSDNGEFLLVAVTTGIIADIMLNH
jgi:Ni/Co efflux regulator RcnB